MPLSPTMRRDVISAYGATFARIVSWVIVSAVVYRYLGKGAFALMSFVRGTIGILNYAAVGLAPAMIRLLAEARVPRSVIPAGDGTTLEYAAAPQPRVYPVVQVFANGLAWSFMTCALGMTILSIYVRATQHSKGINSLTVEADQFIIAFGVGLLLRLISDPASAVLQTSGRIVHDNLLIIGTELLWTVMAVNSIVSATGDKRMLHSTVGFPFVLASMILLMARMSAARRVLPTSHGSWIKLLSPALFTRLFTFGSLVTLAQLADYLYSPTDFLLISWLLHPIESATYGPAVQIDAGLLMLVSALGTVLLPKAALAHTSGDHARLRQYYFRGTLASALILLVASTFIWLTSPLLFRLWFGDPMPATQAILPWILISTIAGGSAIVGRSILLGMGKVAPFTISVLIAGMSNVVLSWIFVAKFNLGLRGIILGTIIAVVARSAIWMPWYVLRTLRRGSGTVP